MGGYFLAVHRASHCNGFSYSEGRALESVVTTWVGLWASCLGRGSNSIDLTAVKWILLGPCQKNFEEEGFDVKIGSQTSWLSCKVFQNYLLYLVVTLTPRSVSALAFGERRYVMNLLNVYLSYLIWRSHARHAIIL